MRSVTLKSAITPSFIGLMATMLPGVRPSISLASLPTASTSPVFLLMATMEGSFTTMPLPRAYTSVLAVRRSMARSLEKTLNNDRRLCRRDALEWKPLFDMREASFSDLGFFSLDPAFVDRAQLLLSGNTYRLNSMGIPPIGQQTKVLAPRVTDHYHRRVTESQLSSVRF